MSENQRDPWLTVAENALALWAASLDHWSDMNRTEADKESRLREGWELRKEKDRIKELEGEKYGI